MTRKPHYLRLDSAGVCYVVYQHPGTEPSVESVAEMLGIQISAMYKSLLVKASSELAICCIPVLARLDTRELSRAMGVKKVRFARLGEVEGLGRLEPHGISPLMQSDLPIFIDTSATALDRMYIGGGFGLEVELDPNDLIAACNANVGPYAEAI